MSTLLYILCVILHTALLALAEQPEQAILRGTWEATADKPQWNVSSLSSSFHSQFQPLDNATSFITSLAESFPDLINIESIGYSALGSELLVIQIEKKKERRKRKKGKRKYKKKPRFLVFGAQHAREWIATSTAMYLSHALVADPEEPGSMTSLLDIFDFHIVPLPNPDGYEYTWTDDRLWYKNRMQVDKRSPCHGVDMNRNWGYKWRPPTDEDQTEAPCMQWFPGTRPYQAPEVNALENYVTRLKRVKAFVDLRNFGQTLATPYSYSCEKTPRDAEDQMEAALGAVAALFRVHGTTMTTGLLCETLYSAPGNVLDWMYAERGVKYSYAAFLRDTGIYGYLLPPAWIRPVGEETAAMVQYIAEFVAKELDKKKNAKFWK